MTPVTLTLDLIFNNRVTAGLDAIEDHWTDEFGYAVTLATAIVTTFKSPCVTSTWAASTARAMATSSTC